MFKIHCDRIENIWGDISDSHPGHHRHIGPKGWLPCCIPTWLYELESSPCGHCSFQKQDLQNQIVWFQCCSWDCVVWKFTLPSFPTLLQPLQPIKWKALGNISRSQMAQYAYNIFKAGFSAGTAAVLLFEVIQMYRLSQGVGCKQYIIRSNIYIARGTQTSLHSIFPENRS